MINKEKIIPSVVICLCSIMSCFEIFLSYDGIFKRSTLVTKKLRQLGWRPLVNTSLISQFREKVISFSFLANALAELLHLLLLKSPAYA